MKKQNSIILSLISVAVLSVGMFSTINTESEFETVIVGSVLPNYPIDFLAENTSFAVKGKVIELIQVPVQYDVVGIGNIFTDVVIDVKRDVSEKYTDDTITVRVQGGETNNAKYVYESSPEFTVGEMVFILVADKEPESIYGDNYYVAGLQHGKFTLDENGNAKNKNPDRDMSEKSLEDKIKKTKQKIQKVK
jgi:Phr family secreted Rap phosphatase inhibitor